MVSEGCGTAALHSQQGILCVEAQLPVLRGLDPHTGLFGMTRIGEVEKKYGVRGMLWLECGAV